MKKVLLIEDRAEDREMVLKYFKNQPYEFLEAGSAERGIALLDRNPDVRVVLLDLALGTKSGIQVLEHIHNTKDSAAYRVIVFTGHQNMLRARRAHGFDVFTYLVKAENSAESVRFSVEQAFNDLERHELNAKLTRLQAVQKKINAHASLRKTLDLIGRSLLDTVGGYTCHIRVYHFNRGDYFTEGYAGEDELRSIFDPPRAKGDLFSGRVVESGQPELFEDLQTDERFLEFARTSLKERITTPAERKYWKSVRSAYLVPISTSIFGEHVDQVDAVLNINSDQRRFFTPEKCAIVDEFVDQATLAITRDWLHRKRQEMHADYKAIAEMLHEVSAAPNKDVLHSIFATVTDRISKIVNPEIVSIFLYDDTDEVLDLCAERRGGTLMKELAETYKSGQSLTGSVFADNDTIHLPKKGSDDKAEDDERFDKEHKDRYLKNIPSKRVHHYIGVPIRINGKARGVLRVVNKRSELYDAAHAATNPLCILPRGFSDDCRNAVEIAATHLAVAIQNAELMAQKDRQFQQLRAIAEVGSLINSERGLQEVLHSTIRKMSEVMRAEICLLFLVDEGGQQIILRESFGLGGSRALDGASYAFGEGVTGTVAATGEPKRIGRTYTNTGKYDNEIAKILTDRAGEPTRIESLMVVPIKAREKDATFGAMKVINKAGEHTEYTDEDLSLFQVFADFVAVAIANAQANDAVDREELAVEDRNRALSLLVRAVAHEINNSFGIIPTNLGAVRARLKSPGSEVAALLARIDEAARQANDFANTIAGFSATHTGEKTIWDLNEVVRRTVATIDPRRFDPKGAIGIDFDLSPDPLTCDVYYGSFAQSVRNIVINAFQALEGQEGGRIVISSAPGTGSQSGRAVIRFRDNGPGIRPEFLEKVFEPEFTTKKGANGNGVGLWLVRDQLKLVDGSIGVESELDSGATFTITIPLAPEEEAAR